MTTSTNGYKALAIAISREFDAILLEVALPGIDGLEIIRQLRGKGTKTPIVVLSARDSEPDIIRALDYGADDYITKPFSFSVLLARLRAVTRRAGHASSILTCSDLQLNVATHEATRGGCQLHLTRTEFLLLKQLMESEGHAVSKQSLVAAVWGPHRVVEKNTLEAFIGLLRRKVESYPHSTLIRTIRGFGYAMRDEQAELDAPR